MTKARQNADSGLVLLTSASPSAASSVSFTDIFNSTYKQYRVVGNLSVASSSYGLLIRARVGSTDTTSGYYGSNFVTKYNGTTTIVQASNNASYLYAIVLQGTTAQTSFSFDVVPNGASVVFSGTGYDPYESGPCLFGGQVNTSGTVTGLTLFPGNSTITGTIKIYGYK
jgi:hypothetical protein